MFWKRGLKIKGDLIVQPVISGAENGITKGMYSISNAAREQRQCSLLHLSYQAGDAVVAIDSFYLYLLPDYEELDASKIVLEGQSEIKVEASFPLLPLPANIGDQAVLMAEFEVEGKIIKVSSEYEFVIRPGR